MIDFKIERASNTHCDLYFAKEVNKRDGTSSIEYTDKLYGIPIKEVPTIVAHRETQENFKGKSLKEYLIEFYKNWKDANSRA